MTELEAVRKAASAVGRDPAGIEVADPRFDGDGLLVLAMTSDEFDRDLTRRHFGFEADFSLEFSEHSGSDATLHLHVLQNILRITLAFAQEPGFAGDLIYDFTDDAYLAHVEGGALVLSQTYWSSWEAAPEVLTVVPLPHRFSDLRVGT